MNDTEIARRFTELVKNKGSHPRYHDEVVEELRIKWPLLYELIKQVEQS